MLRALKKFDEEFSLEVYWDDYYDCICCMLTEDELRDVRYDILLRLRDADLTEEERVVLGALIGASVLNQCGKYKLVYGFKLLHDYECIERDEFNEVFGIEEDKYDEFGVC